MAHSDKDIGKLIEEETEKRLDIMGRADYQFPEKATKIDAAAIIIIIVVCILLIIACTTGVIE